MCSWETEVYQYTIRSLAPEMINDSTSLCPNNFTSYLIFLIELTYICLKATFGSRIFYQTERMFPSLQKILPFMYRWPICGKLTISISMFMVVGFWPVIMHAPSANTNSTHKVLIIRAIATVIYETGKEFEEANG